MKALATVILVTLASLVVAAEPADQLAAQALGKRGEEHFRHARIREALADFDRQIELRPDLAPQHWQRGIALYYAGEYEKGRAQFELHQTVNPQDVENAAWHFLCAVRSPQGAVESARENLISVERDPRVPMQTIQRMFAGKLTPDEVFAAAEETDEAAKFYADLYVGLYYEALGRGEESLRHVKLAADSPAARNSYMGDVARVHVLLRTAPEPLPQAHAHNDYHHPRPLEDALDRGFCSVEADIFLKDGQLLVGHEEEELNPERSLEALYLEPLRRRVKETGRVYPGGPPLTLLIDIKSDGPATYAALHELLEEYADLLSVVENGEYGEFREGAVTVIVSGNRPQREIAAGNPRYAGIDGRLSDLDSESPSHLLPLISDNWGQHFTWRGDGPMPADERQRLREIVAKAHAKGRRVRFWATPENPALWAELVESGVDLIGTDDLDRLREFLKERRAAVAAPNDNYTPRGSW